MSRLGVDVGTGSIGTRVSVDWGLTLVRVLLGRELVLTEGSRGVD